MDVHNELDENSSPCNSAGELWCLQHYTTYHPITALILSFIRRRESKYPFTVS